MKIRSARTGWVSRELGLRRAIQAAIEDQRRRKDEHCKQRGEKRVEQRGDDLRFASQILKTLVEQPEQADPKAEAERGDERQPQAGMPQLFLQGADQQQPAQAPKDVRLALERHEPLVDLVALAQRQDSFHEVHLCNLL